MTRDQEVILTNRLKQEGKMKGLMDKALDTFVQHGLRREREKQLGRSHEAPRPSMGENSRKVDFQT